MTTTQGTPRKQVNAKSSRKRHSTTAANSKGTGRPTIRTEANATEICERLAQTESLVDICKDAGMPSYRAVMKWLAEDPAFSQRYARAHKQQADYMAEDILRIADDSQNDYFMDAAGKRIVCQENIARSKLRVDTRKWLMTKLAPKKYGDRQQVDMTVETKPPLTIQECADRLAALRARREQKG